MNRRSIAAATLALLLSALQPAAAQDRALLQLDWIPTGEHAHYFAGVERGFWRENGIELSLTRGYSSPDTIGKLAAGAAQWGVVDIAGAMAARSRQNTPIRVISALYTHSPHAMFVLKSSGITNLSGLAGKRAVASAGNSHRLYFPEVARRAGIDPASLNWVTADGSAMAAMLISRRVDAAPFYAIHAYYQNKAAVRAGEEIVVLPYAETGFSIYAASIVATEDMLRQNPDLTRRFLRGLQQSLEWTRDNPQEACRLHVRRNPEVAQDDCEGSVRATMSYVFNDHQRATGLGRFEPARLAETWRIVAASQELAPASLDPATLVDTGFLP
jgi:NitT/TauT family transport system substrate-binding protein